MHLNQYDGNDTSVYYVNASDSCGNSNCSDGITDDIDLVLIPPNAPDITGPTNGTYSSTTGINITYSNSTPMIDAEISYYNISLFDCDGNFNSTITTNNSIDNSYYWINSSTPEGCYVIEIMACDNNTNCESGYSEDFMIDNTNPLINFSSGTPANATTSSLTYIAINWTFTETNFANVTAYLYNSTLDVINTTTFKQQHMK